MIQSHYPVWKLPRDARQKLRTAGIKATDLASWGTPSGHAPEERLVYTYKAKPRWSKARKARAAFERRHPGVNDLHDIIFNITPTATPFMLAYKAQEQVSGHTHAFTCMACGEWVSVLDVHRCTAQPASADPARPFPDGFQRPTYSDETGKGASAARAEIDIMDALRSAVKENW